MTGDNSNAQMRISGLSIYADTESDIVSMATGTTLSVNINGNVQNIELETVPKIGGYSPSGNWMPYFLIIFTDEMVPINNDGSLFNIVVSLKRGNTTAMSFTEHCCSPIPHTVSPPLGDMVTGRVYSFVSDSPFLASNTYKTETLLSWHPVIDTVYTTHVFESGYVNPTTRTIDAGSNFETIYFAVSNPDHIMETITTVSANAEITIRTRYMSNDFVGGIIVTDLFIIKSVSARGEVDDELKPTLTRQNITVAASPSNSVIGGKYVHGETTLTLTPSATFKYGDTLSHIHTDEGNRYASSISYVVSGVQPGTQYVRPDTGATATAGTQSIGGVKISVIGSKWGISSSEVNVTYTVLYYRAPRLSTFSVHRGSVSSSATSYSYNGTYYKLDDFGAYCIILYTEDFTALDNTNSMSTTLQYGTHVMTRTVSNGTQQCVVVSAATNQTLDVTISQYDTFRPYGVSSTLRLSTANVLIDFLANGKGMAVGKNATTTNALDISPDWKLLFYQALVGGYSGSTSKNLVSWMHDIDSRLTEVENREFVNG